MVKVGDFTLQLINAETKEPFMEHEGSGDDEGEHYCEIEPGMEYFVKVESNRESTAIEIEIDGKDLGYGVFHWDAPSSSQLGLWNVERGMSTQTAFKFAPVVTSQHPPGNDDEPSSWTGNVTARYFSQGTYSEDGARAAKKLVSPWEPEMVGCAPMSSKEAVKSQQGERSMIDKDSCIIGGKRGDLLCTITVKYCTTLGLIHAGILPKPPMWDEHRMLFPRRDESGEQKMDITPTRKTMFLALDDGTVLESREVDMFDLTGLQESDDE